MTASFLALNGTRVVSAHVSVPYYGTWSADVMMPATPGQTIAAGASVTLTLGNLSLVGAVYRSGPFAGQLRVRCVGGKGGWQKVVPQQQYVLTGGVKLSTVLNDLASAVGESVQIQTDTIVGSSFVRENAPAGRILRQIAGPLWYVDVKGVTQVRPSRPTSTISSAFLVSKWDGDRGEFEISTEDYASWMPGASFSNELVTTPQTVSLATIDTDNSGTLRFTILTVGPPTDRLIEDIRALIRDEVENYTFTGAYEYIVDASDGVTVDCHPASTTVPLPSMRKVPLRVGLLGRVKPPQGTSVTVEFLNGAPVGAAASGYAADGSSPAAARVGDTVNAGYLVVTAAGAMLPPSPAWGAPGYTGAPTYFPATPAGEAAAVSTAATMSPAPGFVIGLNAGVITSGSDRVGIS